MTGVKLVIIVGCCGCPPRRKTLSHFRLKQIRFTALYFRTDTKTCAQFHLISENLPREQSCQLLYIFAGFVLMIIFLLRRFLPNCHLIPIGHAVICGQGCPKPSMILARKKGIFHDSRSRMSSTAGIQSLSDLLSHTLHRNNTSSKKIQCANFLGSIAPTRLIGVIFHNIHLNGTQSSSECLLYFYFMIMVLFCSLNSLYFGESWSYEGSRAFVTKMNSNPSRACKVKGK